MSELSIDDLINTLHGIEFAYFPTIGSKPLFERKDISNILQQISGMQVCTERVELKRMNKLYYNVKVV